MTRPQEPVREYRAEGDILKQGQKTCGQAAWKLALANPGVIITGGGNRAIRFQDNSHDIHKVELVKYSKVTNSGMIEIFAVEVSHTRVFPVSDVSDHSSVLFCPDCGNHVGEAELNEDHTHPELGWRYYDCSDCETKFRTDAAEVRETETDQFEAVSAALERFNGLVPNFDERKCVQLGLPGYDAPSFATQAQAENLEVPPMFE